MPSRESIRSGGRSRRVRAGIEGGPGAEGPERVLRVRPWPATRKAVGSPWRDRACRGLNVVVAVLGLVVCAPIMALLALAVKLSSPGPVLYTQQRVGLDRRRTGEVAGNHRRSVDYGGRIFRIYKFRTMTQGHGPVVDQVWASPDDPRITRVGGFLRKYRLDELPQLWNVLRGDMNVVGPRPEQPDIFLELKKSIPEYPARQRVLPGITGWAQIHHSYDQCLDDVRTKVALDLAYIQDRTVLRDLSIMVRTVPVMVGRKGAL